MKSEHDFSARGSLKCFALMDMYFYYIILIGIIGHSGGALPGAPLPLNTKEEKNG